MHMPLKVNDLKVFLHMHFSPSKRFLTVSLVLLHVYVHVHVYVSIIHACTAYLAQTSRSCVQ